MHYKLKCLLIPTSHAVSLMLTVHEGYGDDNQSTLEPFPFSQPVEKVKEEDAELRRQLKNMGKGNGLAMYKYHICSKQGSFTFCGQQL